MPKGFIYIGSSAGSYVACPNIEMACCKHQDGERYGLKDLTGMNLVPFLMTVHYDSKYEAILKEKIPQTNFSVKILSDEQAILVKNDNITLLGGEEIKLT